jgi:PII interaction protein X
MSTETYLNHPNFGLLFRVCMVDDIKSCLPPFMPSGCFFWSNITPSEGLVFQPLGRSNARIMLEGRMRVLQTNRATRRLRSFTENL